MYRIPKINIFPALSGFSLGLSVCKAQTLLFIDGPSQGNNILPISLILSQYWLFSTPRCHMIEAERFSKDSTS